jgi:toxin ParE1/3/4
VTAEVATQEVYITRGAERDLAEIHRYVEASDSPSRADRLLDRILETAEQLVSFPERGHVPKELEAVGIRDYRQVLVGPYRLIYRVREPRVHIYVIADARRNMRSLLERRLLGG